MSQHPMSLLLLSCYYFSVTPPPYLCKNYTAKRGVRQQARLLTATAITNELQAALPVVWWGYIHNRGN